ncbi:MAG: MobC family plasmid mobilization relaxosome protein [Bacteroidales bacterium]|jgi:hypothetical protein|nr:MobC family plasmid mobilization relaxosome protein [Bacteroidales bacterium]
MEKKKSGGRPIKKLGEKKKYLITVKLDTGEYISLKTKVKMAGICRSEFIRQCLLGSVILPRLTPELNDYIRKLSGMGNNLNQIARKANAEGYSNARNECLLLLKQIDKIIGLIENDGKNS